MDIGRLVKDARCERRLTQAELAEMVGTTQAAISRLERQRLSPTVDTLVRVFDALGLRMGLSLEPVETWVDDQQLRDAARRTPAQRVDNAIASMQGLSGLVGAARRG